MSNDEARIRKLILELKSNDINAYHNAVDELVAIGKSVFPLIVQAITDGSLPIAAAYEVLREIGVVTPQLVDVLLEYYPTTIYDNEHKAIQGILSEAEGDAFERVVFHLQNHERDGVRLAAIETLSEYHRASVLAVARSALSDPYEEVRACAVYILTDRPNRDSVPALIHMLDDEDDLVRADSAGALANIGDPSAIPPLIDHLDDLSPLMRMDVISALGELDAVEGIPAIIELLPLTKVDYSSKEKVSDVAVRVLKKLGTPEALQAVEKWQSGQR